MKLSIKWALALIVCGVLATGCNDDENGGGPQPAAQTVAAFQKQFPGATDVAWSKKNGYDVASFTLASRAAATPRNSAWYPEGGTACAFTKFEISWTQLQEEAPAVAEAWNASPYKSQGYRLDDEIDRKTYADTDPTYKLEIERGDTERELVYKQDGTLLSDRTDADDGDEADEDDPSPQPILEYIASNLPDALIVECDTERAGGATFWEVEIAYRNRECDLIFDDRFAFKAAAEEIEEEEYDDPAVLPAAVYAKFRELAGGNELDEVVKLYLSLADFKAAANPRYLGTVEDERTDRETTYLLDAQGNLLE
ncbi:hypothetical protein [Alistipes sp.]|uniref:hypothetical protein n=1 Tax=Alistipes sp. TaxID=1872444 RepID=UPI003AF10050